MKEQFISELIMLRHQHDATIRGFAKDLECSATHLCDLEHGNRTPSVRFIEKLCQVPIGPSRKRWHLMGARTHGWKV